MIKTRNERKLAEYRQKTATTENFCKENAERLSKVKNDMIGDINTRKLWIVYLLIFMVK
ncbi:MAG: hypothetical protein IKY94_07950 [Lachnospiraceae bacterium]|nr:hypothetical protein [Lachnospiraceae bacterium]